MISRRAMLAALGALGLLTAGCDSKNAAIPPANKTPRIVVLSPALAITMRALGLDGHIVGRHGYDLILDESIPVCGDQSGLSYESIIQLKPTHVLTQYDSGDVPPKLLELSKSQGFETVNYRLLTLDAVRASAADLAKRFSVSGETVDQMFAMSLAKHDYPNAGKVLLLAGLNPPGVLGPGSFHYQIFQNIGGLPVPTTGAPYITMDAEDVLKLKPDAIIMILPLGKGIKHVAVSTDELIGRLGAMGKLEIPAIKDKRVVLIDNPLAHTPSTALMDIAAELRMYLERWNQQPAANESTKSR